MRGDLYPCPFTRSPLRTMASAGKQRYPYAVEVEPGRKAVDGGPPSTTPVYRSDLAGNGWVKDVEGSVTLYEVFLKSADKFGDRPLHGRRPVDAATGKAGPFEWQTYREVKDIVSKLARYLSNYGCKKGSSIGIYGPNSPEWSQAMQASSWISGICVPIYDTLGPDVVNFIIEHSEMEFVFCAAQNYAKLLEGIGEIDPANCKLKGICIWGDSSVVQKNNTKGIEEKGIKVHVWDEFISFGGQLDEKSHPPVPPGAEDVCTYMYTSGTTGQPKGVVITHRALVSAVAGMVTYGNARGFPLDDEVYLSFLTLAHIYGRVIEECMVCTGSRIGYWQGDIKKLSFDILELRPTVFTGVPRVWERIYDKVMERLSQLGFIGRCIFNSAVAYKSRLIRAGYKDFEAAPLLDKILFRGIIQKKLGGRLKFVASGAAPLSPHLEEFIRVALGTHGGQGYGLTETMGASFAVAPDEPKMIGTVGVPLPSIEIRLESVPEMGYSTDQEVPQGEICLRGPGTFSTYYKNQEEYNKVTDSDGFFHTGDIGELNSIGALKIIDRKKNIFKLSQGEYVAVEKIECTLNQADAVGQIWVYGDSMKSCLVAVVVPHEATLRAQGFEGSMEEICKNPRAVDFVMSQINTVATTSKLKGFERVRGVILESREFDVENNCLTPSYKLKRHELKKRYDTQLRELYGKVSK